MTRPKKIKNALISVYYKQGLEKVVSKLNSFGITLYSTGGTEQFIKELGFEVNAIEDLTAYPSIFGGRVKTLHPKVFGGILARRGHDGDAQQLEAFDIPEIDLVIVDLYPFEETLKETAEEEEIIEKIDVGGISLIRAAAKNYNDVCIISSRNDYDELLEILETGKGFTDLHQRYHLAAKAFYATSTYDTAIFNYFNEGLGLPVFKRSEENAQILRYGENPHQKSVYYGNLNELFTKLNGKDLSYNNLVDIDAAIQLIDEFTEPTFAIIKHTNACGVASDENLIKAWKKSLSSDPISAFGGVLVCNRSVDEQTAIEINKLFFEVMIAPGYDNAALTLLKQKKNRNILQLHPHKKSQKQYKSLLNGVIEQDNDLNTEQAADMLNVSNTIASNSELNDLIFAAKIAKHTKSNTIVLAKNNQMLASGVGQTSRVDALEQAIIKAKKFGFDLNGSVMASDAFFPFPDCVEIAHNAGVKAVVHPGGSIKDQESIQFCNENDMAMVITGIRHFKH